MLYTTGYINDQWSCIEPVVSYSWNEDYECLNSGKSCYLEYWPLNILNKHLKTENGMKGQK